VNAAHAFAADYSLDANGRERKVWGQGKRQIPLYPHKRHHDMPPMVRSIGHEALSAARSLTRRPAFAALAVALFALGIGALTAVFSVVNATMLRPLPYRAPDNLVRLVGTEPASSGAVNNMPLGYFQLVRWRAQNKAFDRLEGYTPTTMKLLGSGNPEPIVGALVSAGFFELLGWKPALGSLFTTAEEVPQAGVVIISHGLWIRRFGGDPAIIGKTVNIDESPSAVIGVMPANFTMPFQVADAWMPIPLDQVTQRRKARLIVGVGRLKAGHTAEQAHADLLAINKVLGAERPDEHRNTGVSIVPLRAALFGDQRATLLLLLAAGVLLLAVATVNVVSLCLSDAIARKTSTMTRLAFGADRAHIVRLRLLELVLVATAGCVLGLLAARGGLTLLHTIAPDAFASVRGVSFDWLVMTVAAGAALLAALVAGVPTAVQEAGFSVVGLAGSASRSIGGARERRRRDGLLIAQVALAVVLLVGAALLARNVIVLLARPTGFRTDGVTVAELTFSPTKYTTPSLRAQHARQLIDAIRAVPGVSAAATIQTRFVLNETMQTLFEIEGRPTPPGAQQFVNIRHVTPEVSAVLGIRLRRGRAFSTDDREDTPPVALVSASFARQYWPGEDPIGRRVRRIVSTGEAPWMEVVGIVDDIKDAGAGAEVGPILFVSYLQQNTAMARPTIVVRSATSPATLFPALRRAIWSVDPNQTIDAINLLDDLMLRSAAQPRFAAFVAGLLGAAAMILVLGGIYAVTLYSVFRRTREIGVRAALGAGPGQLLWTTIRQSVTPVFIGAILGAAACVPAAYSMRQVLTEGVSVADTPLVAVVIVTIIIASVGAALIPARRALSISPAVAMRDPG
jgi:putative ABC transport system permease protein